jgi:7-carboxy-7-deazaguanine synthase
LLETNGSLPGELAKIAGLLEYASVDIKLPEHGAVSQWDDLFQREIASLKILIEEGTNIYCKLVILPSTRAGTVGSIAARIKDLVPDSYKLSLVVQPASPPDSWAGRSHQLLEISEEAGKYLDVLTIPQIHKLLKIR